MRARGVSERGETPDPSDRHVLFKALFSKCQACVWHLGVKIKEDIAFGMTKSQETVDEFH